MIDLLTVLATNGTRLHLSALTNEQEAETDVPREARLGVWHDDSPLYNRESPQQLDGSLNAIVPILMDGKSYFVVAGEVEHTGSVRLTYSVPEQEPYSQEVLVADRRGRRVWMSQPEKFGRPVEVTATLPGGEVRSITVP